jgi:RND family efflux transporter MFP subunit
MRSRPVPRALLNAAIPLLAAIAPGCSADPSGTPARAEAKDEPAAPRVVTVTPERADVRRVAREPGQIEAFETTAIHAKVAGYIRRLAVDIGDRIEAGQVLAELDVPELEAEVSQKRAAVEQEEAGRQQADSAVEVAEAAVASEEAGVEEAKASIRRAEADVSRWQAEYDRIAQLTREQAISGTLLDETRSKLESALAARDEAHARVRSGEAAATEARAGLDKARADVLAARARVAVAEADARRVEALFGYAKVVAPFEGAVTARNVDTGHLTVPGGSADPLFVVARTDRVRISVGVPEADAPLIDRGDRAEVRLQVLGGRVFEGTVTRTSWALDPTTRTLRAEIDLENPEGVLRPGLYAYATIIAAERPGALTVPTTAVVRDGARTYLVVVADGRAHRRDVELGLDDGRLVEIASGLREGETVVRAEAGGLAEDQPVVAEPAAKTSGTGK